MILMITIEGYINWNETKILSHEYVLDLHAKK